MQVLPVQTRTTDSTWKAVISNLFQETCNRRFAGIAFLAKRCEHEGCICFSVAHEWNTMQKQLHEMHSCHDGCRMINVACIYVTRFVAASISWHARSISCVTTLWYVHCLVVCSCHSISSVVRGRNTTTILPTCTTTTYYHYYYHLPTTYYTY